MHTVCGSSLNYFIFILYNRFTIGIWIQEPFGTL
jgi:hypothetical protein